MKRVLFLIAIVSMFSICATAKPFTDSTSLSLTMGAGSKYSTVNVVDLVSGGTVNATVTNLSVQNNNPEIAFVGLNPNATNSVKATGVATGSGTAVISCHVTYTDPGDGLQKSEDKSITLYYTVSGVPHGVKLALLF